MNQKNYNFVSILNLIFSKMLSLLLQKPIRLLFLTSIGFFFSISLLVAQNNDDSNISQKLKKILSALSYQEKIDILNYAQQLRDAEPDELILKIFDQLPTTEKKYILEYARYRQNGTTEELNLPVATTQVEWSQKIYDFGKVQEGKNSIILFKFTNKGESPYKIKNVKSSCDCTITNYPTQEIEPGETATLVVEFNSKDKMGEVNQGIVVYDNSSPNMRSILYIKGEVVK